MDRNDDITGLLARIARNTAPGSWARYLWLGMLQGAGFITGTVLVIALLSTALSLLGVIPGFGDIAGYLRTILRAQAGTGG